MRRHVPALTLVLALLLAACGGGSASPTPAPTPAPRTGQTDATSPPSADTATRETAGVPTTETARTTDAATPTTADADPSPTAAPDATARAEQTAGKPDARTGQDAEFDEIAREVSALRGLRIRDDVEEDYLTREQLRARLEKQLTEEYKPADVEADERVLQVFGLAPESLDLRRLYLDLYTGQILGLYDPKEDTMYVVNSSDELTALGELTYAHEVTHALQDQHFDLEKLADRADARDDDAALAFQALVEGDASVLQYRDYLLANPQLRQGLIEAIQEEQANAQIPEDVPPIIMETLTFPYEQGMIFVTSLLRGGSGWERVDAAYADPPTSTEQILHPEKYQGARDEPTVLEIPDLAPVLGPGWKELEENLFGEFQTAVLLEGQLPAGEAARASAGWDGDLFVLYGKGDQDALAWETVWDSEADAREFVEALREYDEERFDASATDRGGTVMLTPEGKAILIQHEGDRVHYALAPTLEQAQGILGTLAR